MDHQINASFLASEDTIAAISTPVGEGGIGVVRLSGPEAISLACRVFIRGNGERLCDPQSHYHYYGWIIEPESQQALDEVLLTAMRAPHSYTREDVVEVSGHGGSVSLNVLLNLFLAQGARMARPGEFTQRAFINGRIDLTQAEAVLDMISARTEAGLRAARQHLQGDMARQITALRHRLTVLLASCEAAIDFPDDHDLESLTSVQLLDELTHVRDELKALIRSHAQGRLLREGARMAIVGKPNTGKSSLLNALLGESRAIVTPIPGTTRDLIEEQLDLDGIPVRIVDTAGIRETHDQVEQLGVARSRASLEEADLLLLILDRSQPLDSEDRIILQAVDERPNIVVVNKVDLPDAWEPTTYRLLPSVSTIRLSALTGDGLAELRQEIRRKLLAGEVFSESPGLANLRQRQAAESATISVELAIETAVAGGTEELLVIDLMAAATALGEIMGACIRDDVIGTLFSRFCIGK